jgi:uncharacterized protein
MLTRRTLLTAAGGAIAAGLAGRETAETAFGAPKILEHSLSISDAPQDKLRIALVSDPHVVNPYSNLLAYDRIVAKTNALQPDLILLLGDYSGAHHRLKSSAVSMDDFGISSKRLSAPLGRYAVLGNHDWSDDLDAHHSGRPPAAQLGLEKSGIRVLRNEALRIKLFSGRGIWLAGLDSLIWNPHRPGLSMANLDQAFAPTMADNDPVILMAHEPDSFALHHPRIGLQVSGHMHGGQVRVGPWTPASLPSLYANRYLHGHIHEAGQHLVVSGGLGFSRYPVRFGAPSEITLINLHL